MHGITSDKCVLKKYFQIIMLHQLHVLCGVGMLMDLILYVIFNYILNFFCYRTPLHTVLCMLENVALVL